MSNTSLIFKDKLIYLYEEKSQIMQGILKSDDLVEQIRSDYSFNKVNGPVKVNGQFMFENMYLYKDSD